MIDRLPLILLLCGCVLFAGIFVAEITAEPPPAPEIASSGATHPAAAPGPMRPGPADGVDQMIATILARPLFSPNRRPPQDSEAASGDTSLSDTRLAGIVTETGRRFAIFARVGAKAIVVKEGDEVSGWRIDTITPSEVALSGPGGSKTLQPKNDPNLAPPAPPPPLAPAPAPRVPLPGRPATVAPLPNRPPYAARPALPTRAPR